MGTPFHNTPLEQAIYDVLCDITVFKIGDTYDSTDIANITKPHINPNLLNGISTEQFNHNVRQVLETRNNCMRNKYIYRYETGIPPKSNNFYNHLIRRDIATVKIDLNGMHGHNKYLFGCLLRNVINPLEKGLD